MGVGSTRTAGGSRPVGGGTVPPALSARGVTVAYGARTVVHDLDLDLAPGTVTSLVGSNGCGKSTSLRALAGVIPRSGGEVRIGRDDLGALGPRARARRVAMLPQAPAVPDGVRVVDLVYRGRFAHRGWWASPGRDDHVAVERALEVCAVADLAAKTVSCLSGGQRQRVWIAMVLAQGADVVFLDEPTTYLDLAHAVEILGLIRDLADDTGVTVLQVLHDLTLAGQVSDRLVVMDRGRLVADGSPRAVLTPEVLADAFGLNAEVLDDRAWPGPVIVPRRSTVLSGAASGGAPISNPAI